MRGFKYAFLFVFLALLAVAGFIFVEYKYMEETPIAEPSVTASAEPVDIIMPEPVPNPTVTLCAVGDIMMHKGQIWSGYDPETDTFDYTHFFSEIKHVIDSADIAIANLETTFGGRELEFTGYPMFNSPDELAATIKDAGFDIVVTANNHSLDRGEKGVLRTLKVLEDHGLSSVGTYASPESAEQILVSEVNGVRISFLAYTYGTNGIPIPKGKPYLVNLIEEEKILEDIKKARDLSDIVVAYLHFGQEYQLKPSEQQKQLAQLLLENGADLILGSHPHVVQPGEWIFVEEDGEQIKKYAAYSLGNFISAQRYPHTEEGLILQVTFEKDLEKNRAYTKEIKEFPTFVDKFRENGKMRYVVKLQD